MTFAYPWVFALLVLLPALYWRSSRKRVRAVKYSDSRFLRSIAGKGKARWRGLPLVLWYTALTLIIVALARPQERDVEQEVVAAGVDIVLALDMSSSMLATDYPPNRFEGARTVLKEFVRSRTSDRIALVVFAGRAHTQVPLTFDYGAVNQILDNLEIGQVEDGTAIGMGLAEATRRLQNSNAESQVIVLLTDGINNRGRIDPATAGEMARLLGVRIYTIGMGMNLDILTSEFGDVELVRENIKLMRNISESTGGRYFDAATLRDLSGVYESIDALEKSEVTLHEYVNIQERYPLFLQWALLAFTLGWILELLWLRPIP